MIFNYVKLALRILIRKPFFTLLNVLGLSVGFAVFLVLWQYSESELSTDTQWLDGDRIARVGFRWEWTDDGKNWEENLGGINSTAFAPKFAERYAELESTTRIIRQPQFEERYTGFGTRINVAVEQSNGDRLLFREENVACADVNFFDFFSIPFLSGNSSTALSQSNSVVVSRAVAIKYFDTTDAIGKIMLINNEAFVVKGVFQDLPVNTHLSFDIVISNVNRVAFWALSRPVPICFMYLKARQPLDWADFQRKVNEPTTIEKDWAEILKAFPNGRGSSLIQPLRDVVFSDWIAFTQYVQKSKVLLLVFRWIGILVLTLAIINYVSLNASHVTHRLKEIATRKVSGASSRNFFTQFLIETALVFIISIALALTLVQLFKTPVKLWLEISIEDINGTTVFVFGLAALFAILVCTMYPVYASRVYHPRALLMKSLSGKKPRLVSLASFQYSIAILLLLCSVIIYSQLTFLLNKDLGFKKDQVVIIDGPVVRHANYTSQVEVLRDRISANKGVVLTTVSTSIMGDEPNLITIKRPMVEYPLVLDANGGVDENFIPFYGLRLLAGRNFDRDEKGNVIIVSEGALLRLGFTDPASSIGSRIQVLSEDVPGKNGEWRSVEIIGVVKGYRLRPFIKYGNEYDKDDRGMGFTYKSELVASYTPEKIAVRIDHRNFEETISSIKHDFEELFPGNFFHWYFLDDNVDRHYQSEKTRRNQILVFTGLAIGIACMGLLGMISNKVVAKTKEIGIRKVMGAKLSHIASLILNSTVRQLTAAVAVSVPVAWYLTEQYLQNFSERIQQQWWHYSLPIALLLMIMLSTVAFVIWKAARTNPVDSLRYE